MSFTVGSSDITPTITSLTVSDGTLPEGGVRLTYRLTDIYNQAYWTESIDR